MSTRREARAAIVTEPGVAFTIVSVGVDEPLENEVLVEVRAVGLCHSDLHFARSGMGLTAPFIVGHEVAGVVAAVGSSVTGLSPGDHVVGTLVQSCGECAACVAGRPFQCVNPGATLRAPGEPPRVTLDGAPVDAAFGMGGFASLSLIHQNQLVRIDPAVPFAQAALLGCGVLTGVGAVTHAARVAAGDTVAVIGLGGVGLAAIAGAQLAGASRIIGIDVQDAKLALAREFGATDTINALEADPVATVLSLVGGVDHSFEVIGRKQTAEQAVGMLGVGGTAFLIGIHPPATPIELDVNMLLMAQRGVRGVYMGSSDFRTEIPRLAALALSGELDLSKLISAEISLDEINDGYDRLLAGALARSVITSF